MISKIPPILVVSKRARNSKSMFAGAWKIYCIMPYMTQNIKLKKVTQQRVWSHFQGDRIFTTKLLILRGKIIEIWRQGVVNGRIKKVSCLATLFQVIFPCSGNSSEEVPFCCFYYNVRFRILLSILPQYILHEGIRCDRGVMFIVRVTRSFSFVHFIANGSIHYAIGLKESKLIVDSLHTVLTFIRSTSVTDYIKLYLLRCTFSREIKMS